MSETRNDNEHAISNARGWFETIKEQVAAFNAAVERDPHNKKFPNEQDECREAITAGPLSVQVRGDWYSPGERVRDDAEPVEYEILLTTGGPALRIIGRLDSGEPISATLEWQDWGTPWTRAVGIADEATLLSYASHFYFGA
jgi:hypothetical protein